jgi:hypothetical protein
MTRLKLRCILLGQAPRLLLLSYTKPARNSSSYMMLRVLLDIFNIYNTLYRNHPLMHAVAVC